ncbi:unnamed protein product [Euphydryas editha]|uniref:Uncharacterized protein n=1 Tax=Euphydryas editha TaxID=104508 RepID=A0AAU9UHP9_EUPED|nr:unnamed protein product [Euphydryas editha]
MNPNDHDYERRVTEVLDQTDSDISDQEDRELDQNYALESDHDTSSEMAVSEDEERNPDIVTDSDDEPLINIATSRPFYLGKKKWGNRQPFKWYKDPHRSSVRTPSHNIVTTVQGSIMTRDCTEAEDFWNILFSEDIFTMPKKPGKYGVKLMCMTDTLTNDLYSAYIYCGKNTDGQGLTPKEKEYSKPTQSILRLTKPIQKSNRNVTGDSWFTSIEAMKLLKEKGLTYGGTLNKKKREIPHEFKPKRTRQVGQTLYGFTKEVTMVSYVPKSNKAVVLVSSMHHDKCNNQEGEKPEIILFYSHTKNGVDGLDKMCNKLPKERIEKRQNYTPEIATTMGSGGRLTTGYWLSHPPPGEEIFITGVSGSFPDSDSVFQLKENLFNKVDLISGDDRRWKMFHPDIPQRIGKINNLDKFDASFFGLSFQEAHSMDPMGRIMMERTYEAIIDAGFNPKELRNTRTGVFVGISYAESEKTLLYDKMHINAFGFIGCSRSMLANRISHWLGVTGPSYSVDTACSSSLYALEHAFKAIRNGHCDAAIVGGSNLCLGPHVSYQFSKLGLLSPDGRCKSFDNSANGYARSETVAVCFLQKAKDSRRVYAQVLHAKTNCDGYKEKGITYPAGKMQKLLLSEFYEECCVPPNSLEYIEAHGTGTKVGDPEELNAIDEVMCTGRSEPLFLGSIKSNLGHSEAASGICAVTKLCIAYSTGYIPPNINYKVPRKGISALEEGRLKVLTEKQPWDRGLAGINNFGFGGTNAHILLKNVARSKVNNGLPSDDVPRLVCASGRTYSAVVRILDDIESRTVDIDFIRLLHEIHKDNIKGHFYRGYTLLGSTPTKSVSLARNIQYFSGVRRQVCFVYSGMVQGSQWTRIAKQLMRIPVFDFAIERCHKTLEPKGINLKQIITNPDPKVYDNILNFFIGIAAVQIGLTDILKTLGIDPDFIIGHSLGELGCAYADGCFTTEQMILAAYSLGMTCIEMSFVKGSMAVVGIGYNEIKAMIPPEIEVASHNGPGSCIISGPADHMNTFITELIAKEISVKKIPSYDIAYHSRYVTKAGPTLKKYLKQVIPVPKPRSENWLSTSVPQALSRDHHANMSSADYHTNSFLSPVIFEESARLIPANAIIIEIGPHGLLQEILNGSFENNVIHIPLADRTHPNNVLFLCTALGKLYEAGLNPHLANIYPTVEFPVAQATPMLAHLVEWEHNENWFTSMYKMINQTSSEEKTVRISLTNEESNFLLGHVADGRQLFPATAYLVMVWEAFATMMGQLYTELSVIFENVRFQRATNIPQNGDLEFIVVIQKGSGLFEIVESKASIVTGRIRVKKNVGQDYRWLPAEPESTGPNVKHLLTKDFYKELRLRGYQYSGLFRGVLGCNIEGTRGRLAWDNEWVTFLDCMLQMRIISQDTRGLFVPTRIEKLSIDVNMHYDAISKMNLRRSFEVRVYPYADVVRASGVEIRGLHTTPVPKRIPLDIPVLEKYLFVPNFGKSTMKIEDILRSNIELILENVPTYKVKSIEIVDDEYKANRIVPIMDKVADIIGDLSLMQAELQVLSKDAITMTSNINISNKKLLEETNILLLIGANLLKRPEILKEALSSLRDKGFIISREIEPINIKDYSDKYDIIGIQKTGFEFLVLFRKRIGIKSTNFVKIITTDETYAWIDKVKEGLKGGKKLIIYSQDEEINGLLGLVNCLRREPGGENVRGLLIADPTAPPFNPNLKFYAEQLDMDLAINVYHEGQWGTYRHLLLGDLETIPTHHAFVKTVTVGDLSSQQWLEGPIKENQLLRNPNNVLINVYCASLNFRDVMYATGHFTVDAIARGRLAQECIQGIEVVGRTINGTRVMALVKHSGIANIVEVDRSLTWCIPDEWTFEEAASIPVAYATAYFALVMIGNIHKGESILIHAGSGAVGQAAINVALYYGLEVFTTVGSQEKRDFIKRLYPQIKDSHIGNSRDTSFEGMIKEQTNGKGIDLVLNSLSDDKLQASVRCLGYRGRFLEIGKFNISNNTFIDMNYFLNEISFHGIVLDYMLDGTSSGEEFAKTLGHLMSSGIESGAVRPLTYCTFEKDQIETAFRYMAAGKHIGKIVFKIRDNDNITSTKLPTLDIQAVPRYTCHPDLVYVVVGGLGGFGLELADWLIMREARKLLLTSRKGVSNGYQSSRLRAWAGYGADVRISTHDITTEKGCEEMLKMANTMGIVEAIFNLAVVLKDCIFENQTPETFRASFAPKGLVTMNLDKMSQKLCPKLKDFVIFSSMSCGRGNAGQTNYGFSNSVMERICERRKKNGLPALAVQWGAIGDVGVVADTQDNDIQLEIGGNLQQRISSCLATFDKFLRQDNVIVSSIVVAEKKTSSGSNTIIDIVAQILGIKDIKTVSQQVSLADLGLDSMMAVEIKQTFEREYEIFLTAEDIRTLTLARIMELTTRIESNTSTNKSVNLVTPVSSVGFQVFIKDFGDEKLAVKPFIYLPTMISDGSDNKLSDQENEIVMFILPGLEGCAAGMMNLSRRLKIKVCVLQYYFEEQDVDNLDKMVERLYGIMKERFNPRRPFILLGYSFGSLPMLKLAQILESEGHSGIAFCIDGSPDFLKARIPSILSIENETQLQNSLICHTIDIAAPTNEITKTLMDKLKDIESYDERIQWGIKVCPSQQRYSDKFIESIAKDCFYRLKIALNHSEIRKIKAPIVLIRAKENLSLLELDEDYGLNKFTDGPIKVHLLEDNHITITENKECANIINSFLSA